VSASQLRTLTEELDLNREYLAGRLSDNRRLDVLGA
jgi:hypothetical protein